MSAMATVEHNVSVVKDLYQAFGRGDVTSVLTMVDPNATWVNPYGKGRFPGQWGMPCRGHKEIAAFFGAINDAVEVQGFNPYEMIADGDKVVVLIKWNGIVRKTGSRFDVLLVHIWTLQAGKIIDYIGLDDATAYSF